MIGVRVAGRYLIVRKLAEGGMGAVYEAQDEKFGARVALKIAAGSAEAQRRRFRREARLGNHLGRSSGFVRAFDWGELDDGFRFYLAMDLVPDASPLDLESGELSDRLRRFEVACELVAAAHAQGVIHRDLKPANFLQTESAILLGDFGLAKVVGTPEDYDDAPEVVTRVSLTQPGVAMGTPLFMPPEQFEDLRSVDERADVYALGAMLFLALTGQYPYPGRTPLEILSRQMRTQAGSEGPPTPRNFADVSESIDRLCRAAIDLRVEERIASVSALLQGLRAERGGDAVAAVDLVQSASVDLKAGSRGDALLSLSQAIHLEPNFALAYFQRGRVRAEDEDFDRAIEDFSEAIRLRPRFTDAFYERGETREALGDVDGAIDDYTRVVELSPYSADAYRSRGFARVLAGDDRGALLDFARSLSLEPHHAETLCHRAAIYTRRGKLPLALADLDLAIDVGEAGARAHAQRSLVLRRLGEVKRAIADADAALDLDPGFASAFYERARAHRRLGDREREVLDYSRALSLQPSLFNAWLARGRALWRLRRLEEAKADLSKALELRPENENARFLRGVVLSERGELDAADDDFSEVLVVNPRSARALSSRGLVRRKLGNLEAALVDLSRSLELDPTDAVAYNNRGYALVKTKRYDDALADYAQAIHLDPALAEAYRNRAIVLRRLGRKEEADADEKMADIATAARRRRGAEQSASG